MLKLGRNRCQFIMNNRPQTLLIGNGFNRLHSDKFEWKEILECANDAEKLNIAGDVPYTHIYERLYLNIIENCTIDAKDKAGETELKQTIFNKLESLAKSEFQTREYPKQYEKLFINGICPFQNVLTTNYDYGLENALKAFGYEVIEEKKAEDIYSTSRKKTLCKKDSYINVWHIHGEGKGKKDSPKSIMLGYDHYCTTLSRIEKYLKSGMIGKNKLYPDSYQGEKCHYMPWLMNEGVYSSNFETWIDAFFLTDIHIIGFGMGFTEIDLWWLLNKRQRYLTDKYSVNHIKNSSPHNEILYYGVIRSEIKDTLQAYGVNCNNTQIETSQEKPNWKDVYENNISKIMSQFNNQISIF